MAGAAVGCLFAKAVLQAIMALVPMWTFPDEADVSVNTPVLLATIAVAMLTAILFGLAPALTAAKRDVNEILKAGGRGNSFRRGHLRNLLIMSEVALSLLLLTASGLLMRSFVRERQMETGIRSDHVLTTRLNLPAKQYNTTALQTRFLHELLQKLQAEPGVQSAAVGTGIPVVYSPFTSDFDISGITHSERWNAYMTACSASWFPTLGTRLLSGRLLTESDDNDRRQVVIVNQTMAAKYFHGRNLIGQHLRLAALKTAAEPIENPWFEIVGVISDVTNQGTRQDVLPEAYLPYTIEGVANYVLFVRTVGKSELLARDLTNLILTIDRNVIPQETWTLDYVLNLAQYSRPRFFAILLAVFASLGLALVSVGVYSVISYTVSQQRHEIGIRMALGATAVTIRKHIVAASLRFVYIGAAAGIVLTLFLSRVIASQVWGVAWYDPETLAGVLLLLTLVGFLAAYVPSVRASRVAPVICLRNE